MDFTTRSKIVTFKKAHGIVGALKARGKVIVSTSGCFDIVHAGHVENLEWAKSRAGTNGILVVGVNSDESVGRLKPGRPIITVAKRMRVLAGFAAVDYVFPFNGSPLDWIPLLVPDIHVKGDGADQEQSQAFKAESAAVVRAGGTVGLAPKIEGDSTTNIIKRILDRYR